MNNKFKIKIKKFEDVEKLANINYAFTEDINISHERYTIDGKSIMGIYSLGLGKELEVEILTDNQDTIKKYKDEISYFMEV